MNTLTEISIFRYYNVVYGSKTDAATPFTSIESFKSPRIEVDRPQATGPSRGARTTPQSSRSARLRDWFVTLAVLPTAFLGMVVWWHAVPWRPECPVWLLVAAISPLGYELCWWGYVLLGIVIPCGWALVAAKTIEAAARRFANNPRQGKRPTSSRPIRAQSLSRSADPPESAGLRQRRGLRKDPPRKGNAPRRSSIGISRELAQ